MADPVELTAEQWGFIYQLIILALGAIMTVILVPHFSNRYQEKQIEIDRAREDRRQQLEIQHELLQKSTEILVKLGYLINNYDNLILGKDLEMHQKDFKDFQVEILTHNALINLYYSEDHQVNLEWKKQEWIAHILMRIISVPRENIDSEHVRDVLNRIPSNIAEFLKFNVDDIIEVFEKEKLRDVGIKLGRKLGPLLDLIQKNPPKI